MLNDSAPRLIYLLSYLLETLFERRNGKIQHVNICDDRPRRTSTENGIFRTMTLISELLCSLPLFLYTCSMVILPGTLRLLPPVYRYVMQDFPSAKKESV